MIMCDGVLIDSILMLKLKTCREYCGRQTAECCAYGSLVCRLVYHQCLLCDQSVINWQCVLPGIYLRLFHYLLHCNV